jgi:hypothetical protein
VYGKRVSMYRNLTLSAGARRDRARGAAQAYLQDRAGRQRPVAGLHLRRVARSHSKSLKAQRLMR